MPTIDERVAYLEGRVEEHTRGFGELRDIAFQTDAKVDRFREELAARIETLDQKVDRFRDELATRIDALDQKVDRFREELATRIDALDQKVDRRLAALDQKMSRQFLWILGIQVTVLIAVVGALVAS